VSFGSCRITAQPSGDVKQTVKKQLQEQATYNGNNEQSGRTAHRRTGAAFAATVLIWIICVGVVVSFWCWSSTSFRVGVLWYILYYA
jgi:hypothetical protein